MDDSKLKWADWLARKKYDYLATGNPIERESYRDSMAYLAEYGRRAAVNWPQVSDRLDLQAAYVALRLDGTSHTLAEMFALRCPPMSNTDREFLEGRGGCYDQFAGQHWIGDQYRKIASAAGVDVTGKLYLNGLARFPGDPEAWVSDRHDVKKRVEERGWSCQGAVNVKGQDLAPPPPDVDVAEDVVAAAVARRVEKDPDLARKDQGELRHETKEMIKPHWA